LDVFGVCDVGDIYSCAHHVAVGFTLFLERNQSSRVAILQSDIILAMIVVDLPSQRHVVSWN
jgi:hypothetical protein